MATAEGPLMCGATPWPSAPPARSARSLRRCSQSPSRSRPPHEGHTARGDLGRLMRRERVAPHCVAPQSEAIRAIFWGWGSAINFYSALEDIRLCSHCCTQLLCFLATVLLVQPLIGSRTPKNPEPSPDLTDASMSISRPPLASPWPHHSLLLHLVRRIDA